MAIAAPARPTGEPPRRQPHGPSPNRSDQGYAPLPTTRCCDDPLSPGWPPWSEWWIVPGGGRRRPSGHLQRVDDELGAHVRRHRPADDPPAERGPAPRPGTTSPRQVRIYVMSVAHSAFGRVGPEVAARRGHRRRSTPATRINVQPRAPATVGALQTPAQRMSRATRLLATRDSRREAQHRRARARAAVAPARGGVDLAGCARSATRPSARGPTAPARPRHSTPTARRRAARTARRPGIPWPSPPRSSGRHVTGSRSPPRRRPPRRLSISRSWRSRAFSRRNRAQLVALVAASAPSWRSRRSSCSCRLQLRSVCSATPRLSASSRGERP